MTTRIGGNIAYSNNNPLVWVRRQQQKQQQQQEGGEEDVVEKVLAHLIFQENGKALVEYLSNQCHEWVEESRLSVYSSSRFSSSRINSRRRHSPPSNNKKRKSLVDDGDGDEASINDDDDISPTTSETKLASDYSRATTMTSPRPPDTAIGPPAEECIDEEGNDDDDQVEFLLTILPPSPKKKKINNITPATTTAGSRSLSSSSSTDAETSTRDVTTTTTIDVPPSSEGASTTHRNNNNNDDVSPMRRRILWSGDSNQKSENDININNESYHQQSSQQHHQQQPQQQHLDHTLDIGQSTASTRITQNNNNSPKSDGDINKNMTPRRNSTTTTTTTEARTLSNNDDATGSHAKSAPTYTIGTSTSTTTSPSKRDDNADENDGTNDPYPTSTNISMHRQRPPSSKGNLTPTTTSQQPYTFRSSAYLQSLAEICHAILFDIRWRSNKSKCKPLFAWERGDDLSVVNALARRYLPLFPEKQQQQQQYSSKKNFPSQSSSSTAAATETASTTTSGKLQEDENPSQLQTNDIDGDDSMRKDASNHDDDENYGDDDDESYDRALNLYARLYGRKGPWFRVDDVFKYYQPKRSNNGATDTATPSDGGTATNSSSDPDNPNNHQKTPISPTKFFLPRKKPQPQLSSLSSEGAKRFIDPKIIDQLFECAKDLVMDMNQLYRMGWIRTFETERECGLSIGGGGGGMKRFQGLLKQDEQQRILSKLGGCKTKKSAAGTIDSNHNLIWKQMCQQTSISSLMAVGGGDKMGSNSSSIKSRRLLPVSKHVDEVLLQSWATNIVRRASRAEYIPSQVLRDVAETVKNHLLQLLTTTDGTNAPIRLSKLCFRLREKSLMTLHRCCRLYLCATSGPGDMRGNGLNAWRSLPDTDSFCFLASEEEGDDEGGEEPKSMLQDYQTVPDTQVTVRPGSAWHTISYPGRDHRFKLRSSNFSRAHEPLVLDYDGDGPLVDGCSVNDDQLQRFQVFPTTDCFLLWEVCVDIRANVDYLIELNELTHYRERKRAREKADDEVTEEEEEEEGEQSDEQDIDTSSSAEPRATSIDGTCSTNRTTSTCALDILNVLTAKGRDRLVERFCSASSSLKLKAQLELDVASLLGNVSGGHLRTKLRGECEVILAVIAAIGIHVLAHRNQNARSEEITLISSRPWLRHLRWEASMAYLLWDVIPILEKRGYHGIAVKALEVLLFGRALPRCSDDAVIPQTLAVMPMEGNTGTLSDIYLSRRARGKAYERLMIDYVHVIREQQKAAADRQKIEARKSPKHSDGKDVTTKKKSPSSRRNKKQQQENPPTKKPTANEMTAELCNDLLMIYVPTGQITFSAVRTLARRLKQPLSDTLSGLSLFEPHHLGHRLSNGDDGTENPPCKKYKDWTPLTDFAVANSMSTGQDALGRRCSYIGLSEDGNCNDDDYKNNSKIYNQRPRYGSLNVEELAMEYYYSGELPETNSTTGGGGWVGWHDEGGRIRAIFRILSAAPILGMDWGSEMEHRKSSLAGDFDWATIHLTPHIGAPFDLHVGAEGCAGVSDSVNSRGFYGRRNAEISAFLNRLKGSTPDDLSRLVYDSIEARLVYAKKTGCIDPTLERDIQQARTLSFVAAGLGGSLLSAIFKCFVFDYRHYSGGLPDLLLVRALYEPPEPGNNSSENPSRLVDLGDWVGETFSAEHQLEENARNALFLLADRDEDFLGCSKVGDSGGRNFNPFQRRGRQSSSAPRDQCNKPMADLEMPERLNFVHDGGRRVTAECMFVEVKSQNDRLDARQEDWLNILDKHGNARVCKFGKAKQPKSSSKKKSKTK